MIVRSSSVEAISSAEFDAWPPSLQLIVHDHARRFGRISLEGSPQEFALPWRSDSIEPIIRIAQSDAWLGVDQRAACVDGWGRIAVSIGLASHIQDISSFRGGVALVCETEVVLFNSDYSIRTIHGLRAIPSNVAERDGKLVVTSTDGSVEVVG